MSIRLIAAVAWMALLQVGCDGRRPPVTEFNQGFNTGVEAVRDVRQKQGVLGEWGMKAAGEVGMIPANPKKSPDWNAGFRQGVTTELKR